MSNYEKFLRSVALDSIKYPHGKPKEEQVEWESLTPEEQGHWNKLAATKDMQFYIMAHRIFEFKQSKGIPEEIAFALLEDKLTSEDLEIVKIHFKHFISSHKEKSQKGAEKMFKLFVR